MQIPPPHNILRMKCLPGQPGLKKKNLSKQIIPNKEVDLKRGWFFSPSLLKKKKKDRSLHPAIKQSTIPFSGWYCTEVDSVLTMLFSYHLLFWMNGSNPRFYNICFLLWRGAAVEGTHVKVPVWFSFSSPWPCFCPPSPWECHASILHFELREKVALLLPFRHTRNCSLSSRCKRYFTSGLGSQVQCNLV